MLTKNDLKTAISILEDRKEQLTALMQSYEYLGRKVEDDLIDTVNSLEDYRIMLHDMRIQDGTMIK